MRQYELRNIKLYVVKFLFLSTVYSFILKICSIKIFSMTHTHTRARARAHTHTHTHTHTHIYTRKKR